MDDVTRTSSAYETDIKVSAPRGRRQARARAALLMVLLVAISIAGTYWWLTRNEASTDDAFTDGRAITIAPQVSGTVVALNVSDNQRVKAGQVLLKIDPRPYQAARDAAAASLASAEAEAEEARLRLETARIDYPARLASAQAELAAAQARQVKADADLRRQRRMTREATTEQEIDSATSAKLAADAAVREAQAALRRADIVHAMIDQAAAEVQQLQAKAALAKAQLVQAEINLSWTRVVAPHDGWITKRNVEQGSYVQPGQSLLAIVSPEVWITANFKESDLERIRKGDAVDISVDAYPQLHLKGHVDSIQLGSGSRFTAFPSENATGNYVKIVQRVPVKIDIDSGLDPNIPLPLGISVVPTVHLK